MSRYWDEKEDRPFFGIVFRDVGIAAAALVIGGMYGCPVYNVYQQRLAGEAQLAKAEYSKRVAVQEAQAKMDSAKLLAQAEVSRAEGVAQANKIIGDSLKQNESYLRYLWITEVAGNQHATVYIPTEANMPILEAGKRP